MKYVTVSNRLKRVATVHLATCRDLGENPVLQSISSDRQPFESGLEALAFARESVPLTTGSAATA